MNFSLVGAMWRDGEKTILEFVGSNAQTIQVNETPDEISRSISVELLSRALQILGTGAAEVSVDLRTGDAHPDHWHALAWSREIRPENTFASSSRERTVVVRQRQGDLFALEDRCAYRQVPLSKGVVRDCRLHCCYHGSTRRSWRTKANPNSANHLRRAGMSSLMI
ncbi:Rieske 2Fe-2S domain-containing protein [Bradyrhizobium icense]|uniref:Rieske 2Fe-2S domain-containing protein n=1 Tax=Bradyrhizobium icense TaxID=1274631 RepID=UPI0018D28C8F|nr:Rieske (2Fe-2S) protein [Bradyrhizobium icense]